MKLKVFSTDGTQAQEKDFSEIREFEGDKGLLALKQVILAYQANQRQGNAFTRLRSEVSGTGRKPFRQKGTGSARQGTLRAPQHRTGGVAHGPRGRDFHQKVNKKVNRLAFQRAFFDRAVNGEVNVIETLECTEARTKLVNELLKKIAPEGTLLLVDDPCSATFRRAASNIDRVSLTEAHSLNAYDLCRYDRILISQKGMERIAERTPTPKAR